MADIAPTLVRSPVAVHLSLCERVKQEGETGTGLDAVAMLMALLGLVSMRLLDRTLDRGAKGFTDDPSRGFASAVR